ncbi:MAG: hypothetical protein LBQ54_08475 [Planctomycetaceae bacterium]|nr:hypothetical protein [Planctomycetaceae bacterium]
MPPATWRVASRMELPLRSNDPLTLLAGKRAASPHIASGWKDAPLEANRTK